LESGHLDKTTPQKYFTLAPLDTPPPYATNLPLSAAGAITQKFSSRAQPLFKLVSAMTRKSLICLWAVLLLQTAYADGIKDTLSHKYKSQILALRSPFTSGDQKFDSAGHSLTAAPNSGWLIYGGIYLEKLNLFSDTLRLDGPRVGVTGEKRKGKPILVHFSKSVRIDIHLDQPLKSLEDAEAVLGRVFFLGADAAVHARPEVRRADDTTADDQIYDFHQDGVTAPKATYTPEPDFSEEARREKFQGNVILSVVVDKRGNVARIRLEKATGHGLDEHAMEAIKGWRFTPGTRNGEAVAVREPMEVGFNLY
jgi:TonB family protein